MKITEVIFLVMLNIVQNKFKVLLTSLGIIVGAATIVMVIAIGVGGQMDVADQFKNLNAGTVTVESSSSSSSTFSFMMPRGSAMPTSSNDTAILTREDLEDILFFIDNINDISLVAYESQSVFGGDLDESMTSNIVGTSPQYKDIVNLNMAVGDFLTDEDEENEERVVVLGSAVAIDVFGSAAAAYDNDIAIDDRTYRVAGVLSSVNNILNGVAVDDAIYMPYSTAEKFIFASDTVPQIMVLANDIDDVALIIAKLNVLLKEIHPSGTFTISDAGSEMEAALSSANTLSMLLVSIAAIVFIVGGIGIMNVLFVSVKERTPEIGVLKALGTSKVDILLQFLLEATVISVIGGVIGVTIAYLSMPLMEYTGMRVEPTVEAGVMALMFAVITGTLFGFYPAYKAASLNPIDALNND
ncbi:MAG: hypothetical protein ATN35_09750 [Epulopiscium sp. Nele67-Bin004]|nr:MAG: hypothetical protein ATN35_09750 [Epulopiscium sp. Nele67-Bin004]